MLQIVPWNHRKRVPQSKITHRMETHLQSQEYFPVTEALCYTLLPVNHLKPTKRTSFSTLLSFRRQKTNVYAGLKYSDNLKWHTRQIVIMSHFNFPSWLQLSDVTSILLSYLAMQHINTVKTPLQADELNRGKVLFSYHINRCRKIRWNQNILSVEKTSFFKLTKRENEVQVHLCVFACSHASNGFLQVLLCVCVCVCWLMTCIQSVSLLPTLAPKKSFQHERQTFTTLRWPEHHAMCHIQDQFYCHQTPRGTT